MQTEVDEDVSSFGFWGTFTSIASTAFEKPGEVFQFVPATMPLQRGQGRGVLAALGGAWGTWVVSGRSTISLQLRWICSQSHGGPRFLPSEDDSCSNFPVIYYIYTASFFFASFL